MHYNTAKANAPEQKELRKGLRSAMTPAEAYLWRGLRGSAAEGLKFRRQQGIGPFVLDFYCPQYKLCIELDGSAHDYHYDYDKRRTQYLAGQGIRVLRFRNKEVFMSLERVVEEIVRYAREGEEITDSTPVPTQTTITAQPPAANDGAAICR